MLVLVGVLGMLAGHSCGAQRVAPRILVYTRNYTPSGAGYVHQNIGDSVALLQRIGRRNGIAVDVSDDPAVFTEPNLAKYAALVFSNSNNQAFATDDQRHAFQQYIHASHGFLGLHSASGSEREWPYFQHVLGGHFAFHPQEQTFRVHVADPSFAVTRDMPQDFLWTDECYFLDRLNPGLHVVLTTDRTQLLMIDSARHPETFPNPLPLAWWQTFDNSREFYLALGHNPADYRSPLLEGLVERAVLWVSAPSR